MSRQLSAAGRYALRWPGQAEDEHYRALRDDLEAERYQPDESADEPIPGQDPFLPNAQPVTGEPRVWAYAPAKVRKPRTVQPVKVVASGSICPRCKQHFRKNGSGLAWHLEHRPNCATEGRRAA